MPLKDEDLISILRREEQVAQSWQDKELQALRQKALDYYDRQPFGDEEEGQSKVVTSEFADTVESVMPGMMRVFASGEDIAEFTPIAEADEKAAKEASQYVPHVFMRENDGFRIIYWFIKDSLMYRVAAATVDTEEMEKTEKRPIERVTEEQMAAAEEMAKEEGVTDVVYEVEPDSPEQAGVAPPRAGGEPGIEPGPLGASLGVPEQLAVPTFSGTVSFTKKRKRVVIDNVASEDLLISPGNTRDIDQASYAGYRKQVTASQLRQLGLKQDEIDSLSANRTSSPEEDQRQDGQPGSNDRKDDQRRLWLVVAYVMADDDGDGISEMLRVLYAHAGGVNGAIIERMKWDDGEAPITIGSVIMMSHTIVGRSLFDQTADFQEVGTVLTRGILDNLYLTNRPRPLVNARVNINSVLDHTPGMPVQVQGNDNPANSIAYYQVPSIIAPALEALGYLENKRDQRTGTSRIGNNMDSDALSDASKMTMGGTSMLMSVAQERQELMARTLAATAFTRLMRHVYRAIKRSAEGPVKYYANGDWQECDPTQWPDDMHLIVAVGTGTGNKQQEMQNLVLVGTGQEKLVAAQGGTDGPLVKKEHLGNTFRKLVEAAGFRATSQFVSSAKDLQAAEAQKAANPTGPPPTPEMIKVQAQIAADETKQQADQQLKQAQMAIDMQHKQQELAADAQHRQQQAGIDLQLMREKAAAELQIARERADLDMQLAREKAVMDADLKRQEIEREAQLEALKISLMPKPGNIELQQRDV